MKFRVTFHFRCDESESIGTEKGRPKQSKEKAKEKKKNKN